MRQKTKKYNPCDTVQGRRGLWHVFKERVYLQMSEHIAHCPRCQKRLSMTNRVQLAFDLLKSQPQNPGLLAAANSRATGVLKHSLRQAPKTQVLRQSVQDQHWIDKKTPMLERLLNVAACLFVVLIVRMGITSSMADIRQQGETAVHNYYARNLDTQLFNEIFPDETMEA